MKSKLLASTLLAAALISALPVEAGSIGRSSSSSSSGRSSSSSSSRSSSFSAPSKPSAPAAAPAPSKPGGIGGNTASMGVRKSEVTAPVAQKVEAAKPTPPAGSTSTNSAGAYSSPAPSYGTATQPNYAPAAQPGISTGGVFMSSLGGSLVGNMIGNSLFGHSNHGGTTVVNNGVPSSGGAAAGSSVAGSNGGFVDSGPGGSYTQSVKKEYTMWNFIGDLIGFTVLVALLVGIGYLFYKGYKMVNAYVKRERGIGPSMPFQPTQQFWKIQNAFAAADLALLQTLLGPDLVDEATMDLQPTSITLRNVSHEIQLSNPREFSVHYTFTDADAQVNQVWHYEKFVDSWVLNGIENV